MWKGIAINDIKLKDLAASKLNDNVIQGYIKCLMDEHVSLYNNAINNLLTAYMQISELLQKVSIF